ncbi:MAG TPA: hypothetical protein VNT56_03365, partial [Acidimicrobiales bacterium]|nr:hypothetical protein [Acidimicrobiales bacterium]
MRARGRLVVVLVAGLVLAACGVPGGSTVETALSRAPAARVTPAAVPDAGGAVESVVDGVVGDVVGAVDVAGEAPAPPPGPSPTTTAAPVPAPSTAP